jgi:branched-subunit amino acid aminotransferase/4-amino-4-deoxychorismate lyase
MELLEDDLGIPVEEGTFPVEAIEKAELVWICNSVKEIAPVGRIDDISYPAEAVIYDKLQSAFRSYRSRKLSEAS